MTEQKSSLPVLTKANYSDFAVERNIVIISSHTFDNGARNLLFWGRLTANDEPRSFGGYTQDIDKCERYAYDEISRKTFPLCGSDFPLMDWRKRLKDGDDFIICVDDLINIATPINGYVW